MKIILLAFLGIALATIGLLEPSYAFWPFDTATPDDNKITIRQSDSIITYDKQGNVGSWQSAPKWILNYNDYQGNPVYAPYKVWDSSNYVTFENAQSSVTVEKNTCSLRIFDGGRVSPNQTALLNSVYFDLQNAKNGTDIWNENPENFDQCNVTYQTSTNGLTANLIQGSTTQKNIELRLYDNSIPELILKVKNNDYSNTDTKYGFAVTISNSSNVSIDGDLIKFQDDSKKTVLVFDTQNSINHYLWTVKKTSNGLVLDYKNAKGPLLPGDTLEIDPTFSQTATFFPIQTTSGADNSVCSATAVAPGANDESQGYSSASGIGCRAVIQKFDITSFPKTAVVSSVQIKEDVSASAFTGNFNGTCTIRQVLKDPSGMSNQQKLNNATLTSEYLHSSWCGTTATNTKVNLGSTALSDFKNQISSGFFAVGIQKQSWAQANSVAGVTGAVFSNPTLLVNYTLPVPNSVTGLSCSPTQALGNTCTWNNATSTGGKVQGFYVTRNGTNEPLYSSSLVGYWKLDGLNISNKLVDYSSTKDNGTMGAGSYINMTGMIANAENFTGNEYVDTPANSATNFERTSPFSISFDAKIPTTLNTGTLYGIINKKTNFDQKGYGISTQFNRLNFDLLNTATTNELLIGNSANINDGLWHNWVFTYDGSSSASGVKIYKDGISVSTTTTFNTLSASITTANDIVFGSFTGGVSKAHIQLDDIRIYNIALPQSQITSLASYTLNSALSKLDTYLLKDGKTYNYCVYPVNQYGQNDTGTCSTSTAKTYAPPPNQLNGKFYKDGSNHYNVQINWSKPSQFLGDNFLATGYKLQKLVGSTWSTILSNTTATSYTDTTLQNTTTQKYRVFSNSHLGTSPGYTMENTNGTGLKTLYKFENNTLDNTGRNLNVTVSGNENYTSGINGLSQFFDNATHDSIGTRSSFNFLYNTTAKWTMSYWLKTSQDIDQSIFDQTQNCGTTPRGLCIFEISTKALGFWITNAVPGQTIVQCQTANNAINLNKWQYVTMTYDQSLASNNAKIYVNSTLVQTCSKTANTPSNNNADNLAVIGSDTVSFTHPFLGSIDEFAIYNTALNSTYVSELYNEAITSKDNAVLAGTHTLSFVTVGDITRATSHLTITTGFPPPTITNWHLYNFSAVYNNTNVSTPVVSNVPTSFLYGNYFNIDVVHNFKAVAKVSNGTATTLINSTVYPILYNYLPTYKTTSGVMWNYTVTRPAPATNMSLLANQNPILFSMNCQIQTASDVAAGKGTGWYNQSNVGYFLQSITVHNYDNMYGTCYTPGNAKLFTFVSYGNSSLFPAINFMNQSYGAYIGVPVGVVFIVMAAALGNRRTAPMWVVIILAMAGIMATVGFFTLNAGVWALALIAGLLCLFVGRKVF